ncbi:MAG: hypothetical protein WC866_00360 [Patescibacteria group bacterium]|jgi:hypothetical protein
MTNWDEGRKEYRKGVEAVTGESGWTLGKIITRVVLPITALCVVIGSLAYGLGWVGEAADVAREQHGPRASLKKYEWFVDQATYIDKMDADVKLYRQRVADTTTQYELTHGKDRATWPPTAQMQYGEDYKQAKDDLLAIISQRNNLVREYNAQSEKFNWSGYDTTSGPKPRYDELALAP